jgi:hypothetical protein
MELMGILNEADFFIIDESPKLILGALWESIYLIDKGDSSELFLGSFDGVTDIGLLDVNSEWAIVANDILLVWKKKIIEIDRQELKCVDTLNLLTPNEVELFVDSLNLNNNKSTWRMNMDTLELIRIN